MKSQISILPLPPEDNDKAINIYTEGFSDDPLHIYAFPDEKERQRITKLMYSFMVKYFVPLMSVKIIGAYIEDELAGALIYTPPQHNDWNNELNIAVENMYKEAQNDNIKLIGQFSMEASKEHLKEVHYYMNELSVSKKFRKNGIGSALLLSAEKEARENPSVKWLLLDTSNKQNTITYQKIGYEIIKTFYFYNLPVYSMGKKIN